MRFPILAPVAATLVVVAAAAVLVVTRSGASLDAVASAATKTAGAGGYHMTFTADLTVAGQHVSMSGSGAADPSSSAADMQMHLADVGTAHQAVDAELVMVDRVMYMRTTGAGATLPQGKTWLKIDLAKAAPSVGGAGVQFGQLDPSRWLQALRSVADVRRVGTGTVQGEQMTHYQAAIDVSKLGSVSASARAQLRSLGLAVVPVDVWVDGAGMVRRESLAISTQLFHMRMTDDLSGFGSPVTVTPPPASDVLDLTSLAGSARP